MNKFRMSASSRTHSFIIQSFFDLIAYKNFKKITIQDILEESQVSKGTFYKHFIDKYDLLKQAYHYLYEEMKESLFIMDNLIDIQNYLYTINRIRIDYTNIIQIKDNEIDIRGNFLKDLSDLYKTEHRDSTPIEANLYANQILCTLDYLTSLNRDIEEQDVYSVFNIGRKVSFQLLNAY